MSPRRHILTPGITIDRYMSLGDIILTWNNNRQVDMSLGDIILTPME